MPMVLIVMCNCGFPGKIEGIKGNRPLRAEEIRRNPATIPLNGFERAPDLVGPKSGLL